MMEARYYQAEAEEAVFDYWGDKPGNPLVVICTGGGNPMSLPVSRSG